MKQLGRGIEMYHEGFITVKNFFSTLREIHLKQITFYTNHVTHYYLTTSRKFYFSETFSVYLRV